MEEKKSNGISASGFFLIIAIIVIAAMGYFIYKLYNDKNTETQKANDLQAQVNNLNGAASDVQVTTDNSTETVTSTDTNTNTYNEYKNAYGDLTWLVEERLGNQSIDYEHLVYGEDLNSYYSSLDLKDGKLYYTPENQSTKMEVNTVEGNIKFVFFEYEKQTGASEGFYAITEDGSLWKNKVSYDSNYDSFSLVKKFDNEIVDITIVNKDNVYAVYYLLSNGQLLDQNGNAYKMDVADSNSSKENDSTESKIIGSWKAYKMVDSEGNDLGLNIKWGTGISYSNEMQFKENGVLSYMIGITASSDDGAYTVNGNTIEYGVPTDTKGVLSWSTLTYVPEEDVLKEETEQKETITYIRAN